MLDRLTSKDYRLIGIAVLISLLSLFVIINYFYKAFPEASIDFKVNQKESRTIAVSWLQRLSLDAAGFRHAAIFDHDDEAKTFLEKQLGAEQANNLMGSQVRLWRYSHRWYKPMQKEEFTLRISPKGEFLGFFHDIAEEQEGAHLSADSARTAAQNFLSQVARIDTSALEFVEHSQNERPGRMDHTFVWKKKGFDVQDASYRYRVIIQGANIGAYSEYLHVPEKWSRDYQKLRAKNETTGMAAGLFLLLTIIAMLVMFIIHVRYRDIRWKTAIIFGMVAVVLTLLSSLNTLPIDEYNFTTTDPYSSLLTRTLFMDLLQALGTGLFIFFLTAAAEPVYRERYPNMPSLTNIFRWRGLRTRHAFIAMILGLAMMFFFGAYQIIFYLVSKKFGGWAPQDIPYDNMLNTAFPWVFVVFMGFLPSVSEEFMSRMFSIPFMEKFVKIRWLAVIIPAFIWGFGHANYPQQPFYIRGLEVGLAGVIIGFIMLRFGILATLIWHYYVDALYTAVLLFRSGNLYFILTAAVGCGLLLVPLFVAIIAYIRKGGFEPSDQLTNACEGIQRTETPEPVSEPEQESVDYTPVPLNRFAWGLLAALALCLLYFIPLQKVGDFVKFPTGPQEAEQKAVHFLQERGFNIEGFERVTFSSERFDGITARYVLEKSNLERLNQLYEKESKGSRWGVRLFKPLQKEEFRVYLDPHDLSLVSFTHSIDEEAAGATISQDSARTLAAAFALQQGVDVSKMNLKEAQEEKRKNRTDHSFTWEAHEGDPRNVAELKYRCGMDVLGDQVSLFTTFPKIPEIYSREREKKTLASIVLIVLRIMLIGGVIGLMIIQIVKRVRQGEIIWKKALWWAVPFSVVMLADRLQQWHQLLENYPTSIALSLYQTTSVIALVIAAIGFYIAAVFILALCFSIYPQATGLLRPSHRKSFAFDAVLASVIAFLLQFGFRRLRDLLIHWFSSHAIIGGLGLPENVDAPMPWLSALTGGMSSMVIAAGVTGILIYLLQQYVPKKWLWGPLALLVVVAFVPSSVRSGGEFLLHAVLWTVSMIWLVIMVLAFGRRNLWFYPLVFFMTLVLGDAITYIKQDRMALVADGIVLIAITLIFTLWLLWPVLKKRG
jgi:membrane protease YdiL (CAAX protease family)